ncbi:phage replisome organizer N-terminal domain-containing protein [Fusobacterium gastrosuis]|uniref:phage replisome organizer N-terminal domain-containing protein n=1 Tax=Fusobacterium gastrosuis TaxID=1755100 RepID=UPI002976B36B|nr:phage replisome organizer N-terminal domain-containing protein [Fusobacteriaceae bacterium]MDY5713667.1 phage replisome organizer N-terminal domain-containing protein [Fusobacterium gastrosuis]
MAKRYYWLKLKEDFFEQKIIKKLRRIAGGDTYTIIYLKLQLLAMKNDGKLFFEYVEKDFANELALELDEDVENVEGTLFFLEKNKLLEVISQEEYFLPEVLKAVGSESASTQRVREFREREKQKELLQCNTNVIQGNKMQQLCSVEKEIEKEIEKDHDNNIINNINIIKELFEKFGINFSEKHREVVNDLLKKNSLDFLIKHFTQQYEILSKNPAVKNVPAVFSKHLFAGTCEVKNSEILEKEKAIEEKKENEMTEEKQENDTLEIFNSLPLDKQNEIEDILLKKSKNPNELIKIKREMPFIYYKMISKQIRKILESEKLIL